MSKSQFPYFNINKTNSQDTNIISAGNSVVNCIHYSNIPSNRSALNRNTIPTQQPKQSQHTSSFTDESDSHSPSFKSSTNNTDALGVKRRLSELSNSAQEPAVKEAALLLNPKQTQPHRLSINSMINPASRNSATDTKDQDIVDLTDDDTSGLTNNYNDYPKPNFEASTHVPAAHRSTNPIDNIITASSPSKNGITTKITISSPIKFSNSESQAITQYCQKKATQTNKNITNSKKIIDNPYVEPTFDFAFKYLFSNLELAKDFIHSTLELQYPIKSLKPINVHLSELQQGNQCNDNQASLEVDGLFKIKTDQPQNNKMLVFLEMQRKPFPGFLTREQIYSALIATNAVKKGISKNYDKIPKVIGIIIALKSILQKEVPYCSQISTKIQSKDGELINVQFSSLTDMRIFELEKFQHHPNSLNINKHSSSSLQWLDFLLKCGQVKSIPDDASDIIKLAYNHMKRVNIKHPYLTLIDASRIKAQLEEQARNQELISAELKGKVESAVSTTCTLHKLNIDKATITQAVAGQLTHQKVEEILNYTDKQQALGNPLPAPAQIIGALNLLGEGDEHPDLLAGSINEDFPE